MTGCEFQIPADARAPGRARAYLRGWLAARRWPEAEGADFVLAVSEAVSNAAEHAYQSAAGAAPAGQMVSLVLAELTEARGWRKASAVVRDYGRWRSGSSPNAWFRGRGLSVMRAVTQSCEVERGCAGTSVTLISKSVV